MSDGIKYFSHDVNAKSDVRILKMRIKHGWAGYGLYWAIIEKLRDSKGYSLEKDYDILAFEFGSDKALVKSIVEDFELFRHDDDLFYSESLKKRMDKYEAIRELRVNSGRKGGKISKRPPNNEIDLSKNKQTTSICSSKNKQIKLNEIKLNKTKEEKENIKEMSDSPTVSDNFCLAFDEVETAIKQEYEKAFDSFRKKYKGTKRGLSTEFKAFQKHKDWKSIVFDLEALYDEQTAIRELACENGAFVPQEKNLSTYLNQRCWEEELNFGEAVKNPELSQVVDFFYKNGYRALAGIKAFNYYKSQGWKTKNGNAITKWENMMIQSWFKPEHKSHKIDEQQRKNEYYVDMSTIIEDEEE